MAEPGPAHSWRGVLSALSAGADLDAAATAWAMDEVMSGNASPARLAAFAVLLRAKGETPDELAGLVSAMLDHATPLDVDRAAVDIVGTGADRAHTVNISTMAALVVAGSGRTVVKHGNRAATSQCGSADVLEELGVVIELPPEGIAATVAEVGIGFCFSRTFHPGMRHAGPVRAELGIPTAFNFLGPLTNPGRPRAGAIGCADAAMMPKMAAVLAERGDTALVFRGDDGLDELTTTTTSQVWIVSGCTTTLARLDPADLGIDAVDPEVLRGGDAAFNARVVRDVLAGGAPGIREAVLLNAAAAIAAHDGMVASGSGGGLAAGTLTDAIRRGLAVATETVDSGAAARLLERWVTVGRAAAGR